jgi:hypothetical protein
MIRKFNGVVKTAASLSLAGSILVMAALPAAAAAPNLAYGLRATGLVNVSPVAEATSSGPSPVTAATINVANLITVRAITDAADATSASSTLLTVGVTLSPLSALDIRLVKSECSLDTSTGVVSGKTTLVGGQITGLPLLIGSPVPNFGINIPGVAQITLNRQVVAPDGTLTVDAVFIRLLGKTQTLTIGHSVCNAAPVAAVPVLPTKTLAYSIGGLGLLLLGGLGYQVSRRRRQGAAAA